MFSEHLLPQDKTRMGGEGSCIQKIRERGKVSVDEMEWNIFEKRTREEVYDKVYAKGRV